MMREEALIMNKYPLDQEALVEEYGDLLIKIALKAYMKEQAQLLEQEEAEAAPVPAPKGNVVAAAFRQVNLEDAKETVLSGLKKGVTRVAVVLLGCSHHLHHGLCGLRYCERKCIEKAAELHLLPHLPVCRYYRADDPAPLPV